MPRNQRVPRSAIVFEIGFQRCEEIKRGIVEMVKRAVVLSAEAIRFRRRDNLYFAGLKPGKAGDRELAVAHQYPADGVRNDVFARDRRHARG